MAESKSNPDPSSQADDSAQVERTEGPRSGRRAISPAQILMAYTMGIFPMGRSRWSDAVDWYCPDPRALIPLDGLKTPRSLRKVMRRGVFEVRMDTAFERVVAGCASVRAGADDTWINGPIARAYIELHRMGMAHSVEAWRDGKLAGGLYGVTMGGAFFGESMFHRPEAGGTDASKVCMVHLVEHLNRRGYALLDAQVTTNVTVQLGAVEIPHTEYMPLLQKALTMDVAWADD